MPPAAEVKGEEAVQPANQADTIDALLVRSRRTDVPIRKTFLQQGSGRTRTPGPLANLVRHHDVRALDLYLLIHAVCSGGQFDVTLPAAVWARALGLPTTASGRSTVSKALRRLATLHLIDRARDGSRSRATLLDEGGVGDRYRHPADASEPYLKLPHRYWADRWHRTLQLPGKALLLIGLSLDDGFLLPTEKGPDWYGISADTVERGLNELRGYGLLDREIKTKPAPLAPEGITREHRYTLRAPFGPRRVGMGGADAKLEAGA